MSTFARVCSLVPRQTQRLTTRYHSAASNAVKRSWLSQSLSSSPSSAITPRLLTLTKAIQSSQFSTSARCRDPSLTTPVPNPVAPEESARQDTPEEETKHAVVSTFDLFSIGIGPSSRYVSFIGEKGRVGRRQQMKTVEEE